MAITPIAGAPAAAPASAPAQKPFSAYLEAAGSQARPPPGTPLPVQSAVEPQAMAAHAVERIRAAQRQLDHVLAQARAGKTFTPAELIGLQAQVYSASQQLDLAGRVVEKATSGVKQVLQTQL